ncbi:MAG: hypothetical protein ACE5M4_07795 [Anaerolineales bacterium]
MSRHSRLSRRQFVHTVGLTAAVAAATQARRALGLEPTETAAADLSGQLRDLNG